MLPRESISIRDFKFQLQEQLTVDNISLYKQNPLSKLLETSLSSTKKKVKLIYFWIGP